MTAAKVRLHLNWVVASIALAALVQVIFAATYPLDSGASDNPVYLDMIRLGSSNLILASGYPFVMHAFLYVLQVQPPTTVFDPSWLAIIQTAQNLIHFYFLVGIAWLARRAFGEAIAAWLVAILGLSTLFLGGLNSAAPEWLQGDLIAVSLLVATNALMDHEHKVAQYAVALLLATFAFLVKYNSLVVIPFLVALVLFDEAARVAKVVSLAVSAFLAGGAVVLFVAFVHMPSTGTSDLNYDHAWVLTQSLPDNYFASPAIGLGLNALRWRALAAIVPADGSVAKAFPTIQTGAPPTERSVYLQRYQEIMQLSRPALVDFVEAHPLPADFAQEQSSIPLYWYVGLRPIDELGIAVYQEALQSRWSDYVQRVVGGFETWGVFQTNIVPFDSQRHGLLLSSAPDSAGFRHYSVPPGKVAQFMRYWSPTEVVWAPGMSLVQQLSAIVLPRVAELCLALVSLATIFRLRERRRRMVAAVIVLLVVALAGSGYLLVGVRDKELISLLPTVAIVYAFGLNSLSALMRRPFKAFMPRRWS